VAHLDDPRAFKRPHRVPSLSADHPGYDARGGYWKGAVWAPTTYMVLRGLTDVGRDALAHEIARNHLDNVVAVFEKTGTVHENYAPESAAPGAPSKPDFVGWTGLPPIAVLLEYVFGLRPDAAAGRLLWDVRLTDAHGVRRYPFGRDVSISPAPPGARPATRRASRRPRPAARSTSRCVGREARACSRLGVRRE
jgi:hypothetical protein